MISVANFSNSGRKTISGNILDSARQFATSGNTLYHMDRDGSLYTWDQYKNISTVFVDTKTINEDGINLCQDNNDVFYTYDSYILYKWTGGTSWQAAASISATRLIEGIEFFGTNVYVVDDQGRLYEYDGASTLTSKSSTITGAGTSSSLLFNYTTNAKLYLTTTGGLYEWNGSNAWTEKITQDTNVILMNDYVEYNSIIYVCGQRNHSGTYYPLVWQVDSSVAAWSASTSYSTPGAGSWFTSIEYFVAESKMLATTTYIEGFNNVWNVTSFNSWSEVSNTDQGLAYTLYEYDSRLLCGLNNKIVDYTDVV